MSLDKEALASLRLDHSADSQRYRDAPASRRRWWILAALVAAVLAAVAWRTVNSPVAVRIRRGRGSDA